MITSLNHFLHPNICKVIINYNINHNIFNFFIILFFYIINLIIIGKSKLRL